MVAEWILNLNLCITARGVPLDRRRAGRLGAACLPPARPSTMPTSRNVTVVSHIDCPGGGQVWIDGTTLYVAHMKAPAGTSVYDVADPRAARLLAHVEIPAGWHSHKVRAQGGVMIVNHERHGDGGDQAFGGGLG